MFWLIFAASDRGRRPRPYALQKRARTRIISNVSQVPVDAFRKAFDPLVLDVSAPRPVDDWDAAPAGAPAAVASATHGAAAAHGAPAAGAAKKAPKAAKPKKAAPPKKAAAADFADYGDEVDTAASRLALVVGKIVDVWPHPDSEKLYCEKQGGNQNHTVPSRCTFFVRSVGRARS